jgi:hypothetical protein
MMLGVKRFVSATDNVFSSVSQPGSEGGGNLIFGLAGISKFATFVERQP